MCRYIQHPVRTHWACIACRYTTKARIEGPCPQCRKVMVDLGRDFKAPRRDDTRQWQKIAVLFERGIRFDSCGCSGPGPRPRTASDARGQFGLRRQRLREPEPSPLRARPARRRGGKKATPAFR